MGIRSISAADKKQQQLKSKSKDIKVEVQWETIQSVCTQRHALIEVWGPQDSGKTHLALTSPGPIAMLTYAEKQGFVIEKFADKIVKRVQLGAAYMEDDTECNIPIAIEKDLLLLASLKDAVTWARTIIIDSYTEAYLTTRIAAWGKAKPEGGRHETNWMGVNSRWAGILNFCKLQEGKPGCIVILIGKSKDTWTKPKVGMGKKTGEIERGTYYSDTPFKCDVIIRTDRNAKGKFIAMIEKPWEQYQVKGLVLKQKKISIPRILGLCTGLPKSEWS